MRKRLYSLDELDDIPGTKIFNAMRSRQAYHFHKFCVSLMNAANREHSGQTNAPTWIASA